MFPTFRDKLSELENFYNLQEYQETILEGAKLVENLIKYIFLHFNSSLENINEKQKHLEFENQHKDEYAKLKSAPTLGLFNSVYNSLIKEFNGHKWLKKEIFEPINKIKVYRNQIAHGGKNISEIATDDKANDVLEAVEQILLALDVMDIETIDIGYPLQYHLIYTSISETFKFAKTNDDFNKIINDSRIIIPLLLDVMLDHFYNTLDIRNKNDILSFQANIDMKQDVDIFIQYKTLFDKSNLYSCLKENAHNFKRLLEKISGEDAHKLDRRGAKNYVKFLDIMIDFLKNPAVNNYLNFSKDIKNEFLNNNRIDKNEKDYLIKLGRRINISGSDAGIEKVIDSVVNTIKEHFIKYETLHVGKKKTIFDDETQTENTINEIQNLDQVKVNTEQFYFAAGNIGSTYGLFAEDIKNVCDHIDMVIERTGGSKESLDLLLDPSSKFDFAIMQFDVLKSISEKDLDKVRMIFPLYDEEFHLVVRKNSGIYSLKDLAGKRVGLAIKGGAFYTATIIKKITGIDFEIVGRGSEEAFQDLNSRKIDAIYRNDGVPAENFGSLPKYASKYYMLIPIVNKELDKLYEPSCIKADSYFWLTKDIKTYSVKSVLICKNHPKDSRGYEVIRSVVSDILKNMNQLKMFGHIKWKQADPNSYKLVPVNIHEIAKELIDNWN